LWAIAITVGIIFEMVGFFAFSIYAFSWITVLFLVLGFALCFSGAAMYPKGDRWVRNYPLPLEEAFARTSASLNQSELKGLKFVRADVAAHTVVLSGEMTLFSYGTMATIAMQQNGANGVVVNITSNPRRFLNHTARNQAQRDVGAILQRLDLILNPGVSGVGAAVPVAVPSLPLPQAPRTPSPIVSPPKTPP
jgi:hypothetical protein